jgi:hypothetical protein
MHGNERAAETESLPTARGRYGQFRLDGGDLVVFDRRASDTWIQSDTVVDVAT